MDVTLIISAVVFVLAIVFVITGVIDTVVAAFLGVIAMIAFGVMTDLEAFKVVDWNVIFILIGIWTIALYLGKTGVPEYIATKLLILSKGSVPLFITLIGAASGFISLVVDNVVVVLMMSPILFAVSRQFKFPAYGAILFVGLCANFMGTGMLLGDLPPQLLHSVTGIEFGGFLWHSGRPSSFFVLLATYVVVIVLFYFIFSRTMRGQKMEFNAAEQNAAQNIKSGLFVGIVLFAFFGTILAMAVRPLFGVHLGMITLSGAACLLLLLEIFKKKLEAPSLEEILTEVDWRAICFYVSLFALVGGLEKGGVIELVAHWLVPIIQTSYLLGATLLYWVSGAICGIVEHDAYILTLLYVIRDLSTAQPDINPWPLYWGLLWAGTLGSNLTIAGAPALFVAVSLGEKEDGRKVSLKEFFSYTIPYVVISLVVCYVITILLWVIPLM
ncbi:MAG: permease [Desulfobacteraceae bacterium]|nr:MAG: permease [Desulfobacteraceae bacterium]